MKPVGAGMAIDHHIQNDAWCEGCGYNLRGLTFDHRCPECGKPVTESVRLAIRRKVDRTPEGRAALYRLRSKLNEVACDSGYEFAAFVLVYDSYLLARMRAETAGSNSRIDARAVCDAFVDLAKYGLGGESKATLKLAELQIRSSEDVGRIVFRIVESGLWKAEEGDSPEDFHGLFTLADLFPAKS